MKSFSFLVLAALLITSFSMSAQTEKGSLLIGGTAGFSSTKHADHTITAFVINPNAGYFVANKLALGTKLGVVLTKVEDSNSTQLGIGPFVRYYLNGSGSGRFFGQGNFTWSSFKTEGSETVNTTGFGLGVGLDYFLNEHIAIESILGYDYFIEEDADEGTGTFGLTIGVAAFISGKRVKN